MRRGTIRRIVPLVSLMLLAACADERQPVATAAGPRGSVVPPTYTGQLGDPLPGLTTAETDAFARGQAVFVRLFRKASGVGPIFNARSCTECHGENGEEGGVIGGTGDEIETHFTRVAQDGSCSSLASRGGFVRQNHATTLIPQLVREPLPTDIAFDTARRSTPDLFGFGLIDAIPDDSIAAHADPNDLDGDGVSGRVSWVGVHVGRFGRKANDNDLANFNAGAMLNEIGITSPVFPHEGRIGSDTIGSAAYPDSVDPAADPELGGGDLSDLQAFVRFLAPPADTAVADAEGSSLFRTTGCAKCHTPEFKTGSMASTALSGKTVRPFSDFLLHDMGSLEADICLRNATNAEFRTEPLMGIRFMPFFMHDGQSFTIDAAIQRHGGEGANARTNFNNLSPAARAALLAYVGSL
jgi:CxxC motif-containing protein (DUF1111 family)